MPGHAVLLVPVGRVGGSVDGVEKRALIRRGSRRFSGGLAGVRSFAGGHECQCSRECGGYHELFNQVYVPGPSYNTDMSSASSVLWPLSPQSPGTNPLLVVSVLHAGLDSVGREPRVHDSAQPLLFADDLAAVRGDGIFETLMLRGGSVRNLDRHAKRFRRSAAMLGLPEPDLDLWGRATDLAVEEWKKQYPELAERDCGLRWVLSRGRESTGRPTGWITVAPMSEEVERGRREGVKVMSAERGFRLDLSERSPWALIGAKTLSYAANMAALRYAHEHDFDDVIFISDDGAVLEGPTSTVIAVSDRRMMTPKTDAGILAGTTQASMFGIARERGWNCEERRLTLDDLKAADGVWLVSSVRVAARVLSLDGFEFDRPDTADEVQEIAAEAVGE